MSKKYGFDEVVDTLSDAIEVTQAFEEKLPTEPGSIIEKAMPIVFELVEQWPKLKEIYTDREVFWQQFKDLDAAESAAAVDQIADRVGLESSVVADKALRALNLAATVYETWEFAQKRFAMIRDEAKAIIGK